MQVLLELGSTVEKKEQVATLGISNSTPWWNLHEETTMYDLWQYFFHLSEAGWEAIIAQEYVLRVGFLDKYHNVQNNLTRVTDAHTIE